MIKFQRELIGTLIGPIWQGLTCTKAFHTRLTGDKTLREYVQGATRDGDFQHCKAMDAFLLLTITVTRGGRTYTRERAFSLNGFKTLADLTTTAEAEDYHYPDLENELA